MSSIPICKFREPWCSARFGISFCLAPANCVCVRFRDSISLWIKLPCTALGVYFRHVQKPSTISGGTWFPPLNSIALVSIPNAVQGLSDFSHLIVVYYLHKILDDEVLWSASHPRGNPNWPRVGIFAQRKKDRPHKICVSICELLEVKGLTLKGRAVDAIDGTPVLDIKPHVKQFTPDSNQVRSGSPS